MPNDTTAASVTHARTRTRRNDIRAGLRHEWGVSARPPRCARSDATTAAVMRPNARCGPGCIGTLDSICRLSYCHMTIGNECDSTSTSSPGKPSTCSSSTKCAPLQPPGRCGLAKRCPPSAGWPNSCGSIATRSPRPTPSWNHRGSSRPLSVAARSSGHRHRHCRKARASNVWSASSTAWSSTPTTC